MKRKGFTLIELMIVVAIIGILAAIAIPKFAQMLEKSREGATKGNLAAIRSAVTIYYSEKEGTFPGDLTTAFTSYLYPIPAAKATPLGNSTGWLWQPRSRQLSAPAGAISPIRLPCRSRVMYSRTAREPIQKEVPLQLTKYL